MVPIRVQSGRRRSRGCMSADFDTTPSDSLGCGRLPVGGQRRVEGVLPAVPRRRESAQWTSRSTTSRSASARNFAWTHPHGSTSTGCGMSRCFVDACRSPPTSHAGAHRPPTQVRTDLPQRRAPASRNGARRPLTQVRTDLSRRRAPTSHAGAHRPLTQARTDLPQRRAPPSPLGRRSVVPLVGEGLHEQLLVERRSLPSEGCAAHRPRWRGGQERGRPHGPGPRRGALLQLPLTFGFLHIAPSCRSTVAVRLIEPYLLSDRTTAISSRPHDHTHRSPHLG